MSVTPVEQSAAIEELKKLGFSDIPSSVQLPFMSGEAPGLMRKVAVWHMDYLREHAIGDGGLTKESVLTAYLVGPMVFVRDEEGEYEEGPLMIQTDEGAALMDEVVRAATIEMGVGVSA